MNRSNTEPGRRLGVWCCREHWREHHLGWWSPLEKMFCEGTQIPVGFRILFEGSLRIRLVVVHCFSAFFSPGHSAGVSRKFWVALLCPCWLSTMPHLILVNCRFSIVMVVWQIPPWLHSHYNSLRRPWKGISQANLSAWWNTGAHII